MKEGRSNHSRKSDRGAPSRPQRACDLPGRAAWRRLPIAPRLPHVGGSPGKQRVAFPTSIPQRRRNEDLSRRRHRMAAIKPDLHASESLERQSLRMQGCRKEWQPCKDNIATWQRPMRSDLVSHAWNAAVDIPLKGDCAGAPAPPPHVLSA